MRNLILLFVALLLSCEAMRIEPFENDGETQVELNEKGHGRWRHGLRHKPNEFEIKVFDNINGKRIKEDCGFWEDTSLFIIIVDEDGDPVQNEVVTVIWKVSL